MHLTLMLILTWAIAQSCCPSALVFVLGLGLWMEYSQSQDGGWVGGGLAGLIGVIITILHIAHNKEGKKIWCDMQACSQTRYCRGWDSFQESEIYSFGPKYTKMHSGNGRFQFSRRDQIFCRKGFAPPHPSLAPLATGLVTCLCSDSFKELTTGITFVNL